jgi:hypothetical protein
MPSIPVVPTPFDTATTHACLDSQSMLGQGSSASSSELVPRQALRTRLQAGIRHPKVYNDGTVQYGNLVISELPKNLFDA